MTDRISVSPVKLINPCRATIAPRFACATLLLGLLIVTLVPQASAHSVQRHTPLRKTGSVDRDLATLATVRATPCREAEPAPAIDGWVAGLAHCAWHDHLQMRQWQAKPVSAPPPCVTNPAKWWSATRQRWGVGTGAVAWNSSWSAQTLAAATATRQQIAIIERTSAGAWLATEWRWTPSAHAATRQWQESRWRLLLQAATRRQQTSHTAPVAADALPLLLAWEKTLANRAGEINADGWRYESAGVCLRMETAGIGQAQLHLPYSREDSRLEQRAAMQVRLARTYPKAIWLMPFRILPAAQVADTAAMSNRSGAMYEAIWWDEATIKGQLWMPDKSAGAIHRARISVALPSPALNADDPRALRIAEVIKQELAELATTVAASDEH